MLSELMFSIRGGIYIRIAYNHAIRLYNYYDDRILKKPLGNNQYSYIHYMYYMYFDHRHLRLLKKRVTCGEPVSLLEAYIYSSSQREF